MADDEQTQRDLTAYAQLLTLWGDPRFAITNVKTEKAQVARRLRALGGVSSQFYLLGAPLAFAIAWLLLFVNQLRAR